MGFIKAARAWANGEVGYIAWEVGAPIPGCLGFMVTRVHETGEDAGAHRILPTWIAFTDQSNPDWLEEDSSVWPIQGYQWRDLTLRKSRNTTNVRPIDFRVHYEIVPVGLEGPGRKPVPPSGTAPYQDANGKPRYTGTPRPLFLLDDPMVTGPVDVTHTFGPSIRATFTNGILSTQNLMQQLNSVAPVAKGANSLATTQGLLTVLNKQIDVPGNAIRDFLAGDSITFVRSLLDKAKAEGGEVYLALYELDDTELQDELKAGMQAGRAHLILSTAGDEDPNPSRQPKGTPRQPLVWDTENNDIRATLHGIDDAAIIDRMFNNSESIGHDKFGVYVKDGKATTVMTGSTNWTHNAVCTQSNNVIVVENDQIADAYYQFWQRLAADKLPPRVPESVQKNGSTIKGAEANNAVQGAALRDANVKPFGPFTLPDNSTVELWCSPNTQTRTRPKTNPPMPPDLNDVYWMMDHAKRAIFFLTFLPGQSGKQNIIGEAANLAAARPDLIVQGAMSDPTALPSYSKDQAGKVGPNGPDGKPIKIPLPAIWWPKGDQSSIAFIRAAAVRVPIGNLRPELLTDGHAIIHDKIIVIDPLDAQNCAVITGSHNLGYKASYANDENLIIVRGNQQLAIAYALHVLDVYDHYVMRAKLEDQYRATLLAGQVPQPDANHGFLDVADDWQAKYLARKDAVRKYFLGQ